MIKDPYVFTCTFTLSKRYAEVLVEGHLALGLEPEWITLDMILGWAKQAFQSYGEDWSEAEHINLPTPTEEQERLAAQIIAPFRFPN